MCNIQRNKKVEGLTVSGYSDDTRCVKHEDLKINSGWTFNIYYWIWNNKSASDILRRRIYSLDFDNPEYTIGSVHLDGIGKNKTLSGSISCALPSGIDLSIPWYIKIECGRTNYKQTWYKGRGDSSNITSQTFTKDGNSTASAGGGECLQQYVLESPLYSTKYYRSSSKAMLFKIE